MADPEFSDPVFFWLLFLRKGRIVALFVNDFNRGAIALYESMGFQRIGTNRAIIW